MTQDKAKAIRLDRPALGGHAYEWQDGKLLCQRCGMPPKHPGGCPGDREQIQGPKGDET